MVYPVVLITTVSQKQTKKAKERYFYSHSKAFFVSCHDDDLDFGLGESKKWKNFAHKLAQRNFIWANKHFPLRECLWLLAPNYLFLPPWCPHRFPEEPHLSFFFTMPFFFLLQSVTLRNGNFAPYFMQRGPGFPHESANWTTPIFNWLQSVTLQRGPRAPFFMHLGTRFPHESDCFTTPQ